MKLFRIVALSLSLAFAGYADSVVVERGPHHRVVQSITPIALEDGTTLFQTNSYNELANGMNYQNERGEWVESSEQIEIVNDVGLARHGQYQAIFAGSAADVPMLDMQTPDGKRLQSRVAGIAYLEAKSGQSAWVALVQESLGQVQDPNVVIYPAAFGKEVPHADIRITYTKAGLEQDIIWREQLLDPGSLNPPLDPNNVLVQAWTEFFDPPAPEKQEVVIYQEADALKRQNMAVPDLIDQHLDFGVMRMGEGVCFSLSDAPGDPRDALAAVRVTKTWIDDAASGRHFLVESVPYSWLQPLTQGLKKFAAVKPKAGALWAKVQPKQGALMASLPKLKRDTKSGGKLQTAGLTKPGKGVVMDYSIITGNKTNYTFAADATSYISGPVTLKGTGTGATNTTTFEGGTVLKFAPTNGAKLTIQNQITWQGTPFRPVVMTARDDTTVGETVSAGTIANYDTALYVDGSTAGTNAVLQNFRVAYATNALVLNGKLGHIISHAQFVNCQNGIKPSSATFSLRNGLFHNVVNAFNGTTATGQCEHITVDTSDWLNLNSTMTLNVTNSLLTQVTNVGTINSNYTVTLSSSSGVFTNIGAGYHYLKGNTYRNAGTTNISSSLATDLLRLTTYPPLVLTTDFTAPTTLSPQAGRDIDQPDLGWHYEALDFCWTDLNLTNSATLVLTNGVAIGIYGTNGLRLWSGIRLASDGKPGNQMNHLTRYTTVQEQSYQWGGTNTASSWVISAPGISSNMGTVHLRFTDVSGLAAADAMRYFFNPYNIYRTDISDSWLRGTWFYINGQTNGQIALTNNLIHRSNVSFNQSSGSEFTLYLRNNLFWHENLSLWRFSGVTTWAVQDCLFDTITISGGNTSTNSYNGYYNTTALTGGSNNKTLTAIDYVPGPLGAFYYPTNGSGGLTNLYNNGSRTADLSGLYHYTTSINLLNETNSVVDIGFHYVVTDANGNPIDSDGDGVPDYLEDSNGNGAVSSGETSWTDAADLGLRVLITRPRASVPLP